jgi:proteasome lid subunit RPN8/RPN11
MIERSSDSQRRIRILSRPAPEAPSPLSSGVLATPPEARFEAPGEVDVLVTFEHQAFAELLAHCTESNVHGLEICGLLLGTAEPAHNQGREYRLAVTDILPLEASDASGAHVSADEHVWLRAAAQIEKRFQGKERLGWYHTHPTQGIFFSGSDKDFHSVFTKPFQFALVVDPRFPKVGLFHWQDRQAGQIAGPIPLDLKAEPVRLVLRPTLADSHRLMLLALGWAGIVVLLATGKDAGRLLPLAALFTAALFFRLWNAGAVPDRATRNREARVGLAGGLLLLAALLLPFFVAGFRLGAPLPAQWAALRQEPAAPRSATAPAVLQTAAASPATEAKTETVEAPRSQAAASPTKSPAVPVRESRAVSIRVRSSQVSFRWNGGSADYKLDGKSKRYRLSSGQETALLAYLVGVPNPWVPEFKQIQKALGTSKPDGSWGDKSRTLFVRTALDRARSGRPLDVSSKNRTFSITFTKTR